MTAKTEWIRANYDSQMPIPEWVSFANTAQLVANPTPQGGVPKPLSIIEFGVDLTPNDRRILQNEYAYRSLLTNINKGDLQSVQADLQNLATTPQISPEAIAILNTALAESTMTIPDPNWQSQVLLSPAQQAGFDAVLVNEVEEALAEPV